MNEAMAQLAELLNINHAKMPREQMAQSVCEKALREISELKEKLSATKDYLHHQMNDISNAVNNGTTPQESEIRIRELTDQVERLIDFSAAAGIAYRDDDCNIITEGFKALPDDLQSAINAKEELIDKERELS